MYRKTPYLAMLEIVISRPNYYIPFSFFFGGGGDQVEHFRVTTVLSLILTLLQVCMNKHGYTRWWCIQCRLSMKALTSNPRTKVKRNEIALDQNMINLHLRLSTSEMT